MRSFRDCLPRDGAAKIISLISHITLLNEEEEPNALSLIKDAAFAIIAGDCMGAYKLYHDCARKLLLSPARRVSGDMFMDHLIWLAVEREHAFAKSSARGELDEALLMSFRSDLAALGELASLDWHDIYRMCAERYRELQAKSRYARDDISVMSSAAWTGTEPRPKPQQKDVPLPGDAAAPLPPPSESEWLSWSYGEKEPRGEYAADEVLEEIYIRLMESPDWRGMAEDLFNLFASSGSGIFLKTRLLKCAGGTLGLAAARHEAVALSVQDNAKQALGERIIAFMRGSRPLPVLIHGPKAIGKTELALSMADEFPELRAVIIEPMAGADVHRLFERLSAQPLRFMLLIENADAYSPLWSPLLCACTGGGLPDNVLPVATGTSASGMEEFVVKIAMDKLELDGFVNTVKELIEAQAPYLQADMGWIRNASVDYQLDAHDELNIPAAKLIAQRYMAEHE